MTDAELQELIASTPVRDINAPPVIQVQVVPPTEAQERAIYIKDVDDSIAAVISDKTRFSMGYVEREKAATAFLIPGNVEPASDWITRFANNVEMSYVAAAELIFTQAAQYRAALHALDNLRMDKYLISRALTIADARSVYARICFDRDAIAASLV